MSGTVYFQITDYNSPKILIDRKTSTLSYHSVQDNCHKKSHQHIVCNGSSISQDTENTACGGACLRADQSESEFKPFETVTELVVCADSLKHKRRLLRQSWTRKGVYSKMPKKLGSS